MSGLHTLRVGALYSPGRTSLPEAVQYNYRGGQHELLLWLRDPSSREVRAVRSEAASFALAVDGPVLFFLYRFGEAISWSDAPSTLWMVPQEERSVPPPADMAEPHAVVTIILVDAATGVVRALRAVTLPPAFTTALHLAIRQQHDDGWIGQAAYDQALADAYRRYPTTTSLLAAARSRTEGGT